MRLHSLSIQNFKSIKNVVFTELPYLIVIAGPNGCGKSTIFDAIRLLKSVYGGYQPNEWHQWFSEFQVSLDIRHPEYLSLLNDKSKPISIEAQIILSEDEKKYISSNLEEMLKRYTWNQLLPDTNFSIFGSGSSIASQQQQYEPQVEHLVKQQMNKVRKELISSSITAFLRIPNNLREKITVKESHLLQVVFSQFNPQNIGIIDYHGPQRVYQREPIGGVNLNIDSTEQQTSQSALYNYGNKYTNIKSEMASSYVREIIAEKAGISPPSENSLLSTLQDLFSVFFPGKHFKGPEPRPDGRIFFPIVTDSGIVHDINDLSSGEKEVLYGYLRLYNLSPKHSVLLIDEPELHLNPRLINGLPQFYQKNLGFALDNQIWLLTHSDTMLREALATPNSGVFHMLQSDQINETENQIRVVLAEDEVNSTIIDLIGDLAIYKPGAKVVIFEGGGDTEFDMQMVSTLFPDFDKKVNSIAGGGKTRVRALHEVLKRTKERGIIPFEVFSITDRDSDSSETWSENALQWDVYHIENYLLHSEIIAKVVNDINSASKKVLSSDDVKNKLKICAQEVMPSLIIHILREEAYQNIHEKISLQIDPNSKDISADLVAAIERSSTRIVHETIQEFSRDNLVKREKALFDSFANDLSSENWLCTFRGREILKRFVGKFCNNIPYESFRNLILARMRDVDYQPEGMKKVISRIIKAK